MVGRYQVLIGIKPVRGIPSTSVFCDPAQISRIERLKPQRRDGRLKPKRR